MKKRTKKFLFVATMPSASPISGNFAMDDKKRRNLGGWLPGNLNWMLAFGLFGLGLLFLHFPSWTGDASATAPQTAATLVGALWGSGALLLGAQINEGLRHREEERKLQTEIKKIDEILFVQFIYVCDRLSFLTSYIKVYLDLSPGGEIKIFDYLHLAPPTLIFNDVLYQKMISLDITKISLILNFDKLIGKFSEHIEVFSKNIIKNRENDKEKNLFNMLNFINKLHEILESAHIISRFLWPNQTIELTRQMKQMHNMFCIKKSNFENPLERTNINIFIEDHIERVLLLKKMLEKSFQDIAKYK